jgi:hypothetical protein
VRPHYRGQRTPCPSNEVSHDCANALPRASSEMVALFRSRLKVDEIPAIKAGVRASPHLRAAVLWHNFAPCLDIAISVFVR